MLTLLHTADVHRKTFDDLRDRIAPGLELHHQVRPDWLKRAQKALGPKLAAEIGDTVRAAKGPVLCTCTTLGLVAETAGAIRIDWPMMQEAAKIGGPVLMAYCLESTYQPSLTLLERALEAADRPTTVHPLPLLPYWPLFEAGEMDAFNAVIAGEIRQAIAAYDVGSVVLAQASMAGAAERLLDVGVPVLNSPELALKAAISQT